MPSQKDIDQTIKRMKPLWRERYAGQYAFFCPNCRSERRVRSHPSPNRPINYVRIALATGVFTAATWNWCGFKGLVSFVPFWMIFELIYRSRMRVDLVCPNCGFDPFLYLTDVKRARAGVADHWRKVFREKGIPHPDDAKISESPENPSADAANDLS